ncbi:uncharacterized protein EAF01_006450 [Botrytis porri]|uniref:Uncharacterized protein n=1 Tax=Botrytis porri TaxID=87229 RepID=A0A4Z1L4Y4_9HELO|nr:uncharacterized protein EAF01_006450 [Botrytis porri]KAF7903401.1 hypothetical protein EAF01_006450 [Botrytis porri]TGO91767.1 hypothetical protein BPOR_0019g00270 [Botrytis porri]
MPERKSSPFFCVRLDHHHSVLSQALRRGGSKFQERQDKNKQRGKLKAQPRTALLQRHSLHLAQQLSRHKIMHVESTEAPACLYNITIVFCPGTSDTEHRFVTEDNPWRPDFAAGVAQRVPEGLEEMLARDPISSKQSGVRLGFPMRDIRSVKTQETSYEA